MVLDIDVDHYYSYSCLWHRQMSMEMSSVMTFVAVSVEWVVLVPFLCLQQEPIDNEAMIRQLAFRKSIQIHCCLIDFLLNIY